MDLYKILKFIFPEYQIIEAVKKHGFIAKKAAAGKANRVYQQGAYLGSRAASTLGNMPQRNHNPGSNISKVSPSSTDTARYSGKTSPAASGNSVNEGFNIIRQELSLAIVGQRDFLDKLTLAFKRPFVTGYDKNRPKNTIFIIGGESTGRHSALYAIVRLLKGRRLISYESISKIDLSIYPTTSEQALFLSDIYKGLYSNSDVVIFENFEKCHISAIEVIKRLAVDGKYKLGARYALQNNNLVEATGMLLQNSISEISSNGKYFIFITEQREGKITDVFGTGFMMAVGDIIEMDPYSQGELLEISRRLLDEITLRCRNTLSIALLYDDMLPAHCASKYSQATGVYGIQKYIYDNIYKPLSEYKLKNTPPPDTSAELFLSDEVLKMKLTAGQMSTILNLSELLPEKYVSNIEEVKEELNSVIGLTEVKNYILDLENNLKIQRRRQEAGYKNANISMHMIFTGNPGTGKTTIARIVARYLKALGILSTGQLREATRADLVGQYLGHTAKLTNEVLRSALGGVLFIDEAYSLLRDKNDVFGIEAVDTLVKGIEDNRDDLVVILAGYRDEMEEFLKSNPGLKSRFPNIIDFKDYTPDEMYHIALKTAEGKGYRIAEDCRDGLIRLFEKSQIRGRNDSGNGRLVRNCIEGTILEQSKRLLKEQEAPMDLLTPEDFKFESLDEFNLDRALSEIIGLENVKDFVRKQYMLLLAEEKRKKAGINLDTSQSLNMVFTGNPGTGKTTIARVVASMFKDMGLLKRGHLVETDRGGLVAEYVGQTAKKTEEVFKSALGGILFIDEAYSLSREGGGYGREAIDTLVKLIEDYRGEIAVIMAGYKGEMSDFMKSNSGLESRFPLRIDFPDYSAEELYQIALKMIEARGFSLEEEAKGVLFEELEQRRRTSNANSGNGRMVRNMVEWIMRNQSERIAQSEVSQDDLTRILISDIGENRGRKEVYDLEQALSRIIGLSEVKSFIRSLYARLRMQRERKKLGLPVDETQTLHMIFKGNPGTGKTMVARTVADVLYNIGVIKTSKLIEADRSGLVAGYVGQTAAKTRERVMEAMDGVLFIDEAYSLSKGGGNDFGREAIDTLVKLMDDYRDRLVVILAGYSRDMEDFLKSNLGLKSRFPNIIEFENYNMEELLQIVEGFYSSGGYVLSPDARIRLSEVLAKAMEDENFGNGRYVRNVFEKSVNIQALRLSTDLDLTREELVEIRAEDIEGV